MTPQQGSRAQRWTLFFDMYSGGSCKTAYDYIFIEALKDQAVDLFYEFFGRDPYHVSCDCCGSDYSVTEYGIQEKKCIEGEARGGWLSIDANQIKQRKEEAS